MAEKLKNCFLVNAPAGSGKTTKIKAMVRNCMINNPNDNILCITYTNRAADELINSFDTENIFVGTIHSFLNNFMKQYFSHSDVLNLYFEIYGEKIIKRIENKEKDRRIELSNDKYREKHGELNYEIVKNNIKAISYNETPFNTLYYGGLSHDDLISFSKYIFDRFPILQRRISSKYQFVFIDEYQDTMADVLKIFYESIVNSNSQLYLFGDRMQQIYKNYDGSFEEQFKAFDTTNALLVNHRSTTDIVRILNQIYNDQSYIQKNSSKIEQINGDFKPRIIVSDNISESIDEIKVNDPNTLVLYLLNKERFSDIGALNLYKAFDSMEKYSYGKTYSSATVLMTPYYDNPDPLLKLMYCIVDMANCYQNHQYGVIVQTLKFNKSIFCKESCYIKKHQDKQRLFKKIKYLFEILSDRTKTIEDLLLLLTKYSLVEETYMEGILTDKSYNSAFSVPIVELINVIEYLSNPKVSTQHGVKGESHDSVLFVAEDSYNNPIVYMYRFFEMWGQIPISIKSFNEFYFAYTKELSNLEDIIQMEIKNLNKDSYLACEETIKDKVNEITYMFKDNLYFEFLCKEKYSNYILKPGVTKAKDCLKESTVFGVLSAYKLFYVGCSRARKNLTILLDSSKIKGNYELQKKKFEEIGFIVE